ncbi:RDD family protein [Acidobacteria bacterium AH-259-D05]|nr:RDD family protein [Acidobacteria bacterium AH-259-D05]
MNCPNCGLLTPDNTLICGCGYDFRQGEIRESSADHKTFEYAGFWIRVWATIIDSILQILVLLPIFVAVYGIDYLDSPNSAQGPLGFVLSWVLPACLIILFWIYKSATPGKMAISTRIVDARTGLKPSNGQLVGRYFAYFVSLIPLFLGFIWIAFDQRKQGWHDKLAGTVVVRVDRSQGDGASAG